MNGHFVISLDFELHWGVFDVRTVDSYKTNLLKVRPVITKLMELADAYDVQLTFATVGFLFAGNKQELLQHVPNQQPTYTNNSFSPYPLLDTIGNSEAEDPFHYAKTVVKQIKANGNHEIGTHTFSHYYCHEAGQTVSQFEEDLRSAISIAKSLDITLESIVFPRNMIDANKEIDRPYLDICYKYGIKSFRGKEKAFVYNIHTSKYYHGWYLFKLLRIFDAYFNITGDNTYKVENLYKHESILNIPSSRLLRPYSKSLSFLEPFKLNRITQGMRRAAKNGELFHLWWHPHNFGSQTDENFKNLEAIFKEYQLLNGEYGFISKTMSRLTDEIVEKHNRIQKHIA